MFSSVYLFRQAMACLNCLHRTVEMKEIGCSQLKLADKVQLILNLRTTCPNGEHGFGESGRRRVFQKGQDRRPNYRDEFGNSVLPTSSNANPFELSPDWALEDNSSDQSLYVYLPKSMQCDAFERESSGRSRLQEERVKSASQKMMKKYFQFDNIIRNGHFSPFMDMRKFIKNLVSLKWPSTGRFTYHNLRNGKVLWSYTIEGVSFSNEKSNPGRGKYLRHRKILAMFVKHLLHEACGTGTRESKKFLLWLCCSPKGTVGESVWHFLTKGDKEVRMWEAEQVARVYDPNYKPEDHIGWDNTDASIPILIKSEMKYGEVDDIPAAFKRKVAWYTPSNTF